MLRFQKWLRLGQRDIIARKLPVSSVERLISAVTKLTREQEVDLLMINLTKTKGENQSLEDTMYGKYIEAIFESPLILVFTN